MKRSIAVLAGALAITALCGGFSDAWAQRQCTATTNQCLNQSVTTSHIQIGGAGSLSSAGTSFSNPGRLDDGTIAEADFDYTFDRSTGRLTLVVTNRTTTTASLTAMGFNATSDVTMVQLISATTGTPPVPALTPWANAFDRVRTDNIVDFPVPNNLKELRMDGFGRLSVFFGNKGIDTGGNGGNTIEIKAGKSVTFVMQVSGNINNITACSFTSVGSLIPPGDKIVSAVGRFQAGVNGGSAFIGPCVGGNLLVTLADVKVTPSNSSVQIDWATASEVDNAGFRILRRDLRSKKIVALNPTLIAPQGSPVSGATYSYTDATAVNGKKYEYMIEDWDTQGINTIHDPVVAKPNPLMSTIRLVSPSDESSLTSLSRFDWEMDGRMKVEVQLSSDARFPVEKTLKLQVPSGSGRSLSISELGDAQRIAAQGQDGGLYWRVVGRDARGQSFSSSTFFVQKAR
jgi:hypothetical protein